MHACVCCVADGLYFDSLPLYLPASVEPKAIRTPFRQIAQTAILGLVRHVLPSETQSLTCRHRTRFTLIPVHIFISLSSHVRWQKNISAAQQNLMVGFKCVRKWKLGEKLI